MYMTDGSIVLIGAGRPRRKGDRMTMLFAAVYESVVGHETEGGERHHRRLLKVPRS
jgi:hypothetical protein